MKWVRFTKRTDDPKLAWLERRLRAAGIPSRRNGYSFHAPILEVPKDKLDAAWEILRPVDDVDDDDPMFLSPEPRRKRKAARKIQSRGALFVVLPELPVEAPHRIVLPHDEDAIFKGLKKVIHTDMLEPFQLPGFWAYGDEDARMKMRQPNPWLTGNGIVFNVVGTIALGSGRAQFAGLTASEVKVVEEHIIVWPTGGPPGIA